MDEVRRNPLLPLLWVALLLGCARTQPYEFKTPPPAWAEAWNESCLIHSEKGCPRPAVGLCTTQLEGAVSVSEALALARKTRHGWVVEPIKVLGVLHAHEFPGCTANGAPPRCYARCWTEIELRQAPSAGDEEGARPERLEFHDPTLQCIGDDSMRCCPVTPGAKVVATGTLVDSTLREWTLCRVP